MERRDELHRHGCSIAKQTILTTHPSGLQTRVSVELANFDALCVHSECKTSKRPVWESPFLARRGLLGGVSAQGTPVLGRRSDAVNDGRLSQQCTPVMRRREMDSPGGSPLPTRRMEGEEEETCDLDNSVISGWLKFRDNKRWKSRWGVVTKLSPAADGGIFDFEEPPLQLSSETQPRPDPEDIVPRENLSTDKNDGNRDEILPEADSSADTALDSIVLDILGEDPLASSDYGKAIHNQLANRLEHFATSGLTKDARKELSDKYLVPSNCVRIGAPILNAEIKAALPENLIKRDKAIEARQKLLAKAISCLASAVTDQLNRDDKNQELLKSLMDTGRLLCDIQHAESLTRRNFALFYVKKELKEHLSNTKIDKYLFGENLSEALKAAKAVSKSGTDLKHRTNYKKPAPSSQKPPAKNLNWKPPVPARRQQGPQRSQEPAQPRQPSSSSKPSQRPYRTTRRQ